MLQFGRLPLAKASAHKGQEVPFGNPRFIGSMRLPGVISRLGTTFIGSRTERSPIWFVATFLKSNYSIEIDFGFLLSPGCVCTSNLLGFESPLSASERSKPALSPGLSNISGSLGVPAGHLVR
jgi:hypothetical protein